MSDKTRSNSTAGLWAGLLFLALAAGAILYLVFRGVGALGELGDGPIPVEWVLGGVLIVAVALIAGSLRAAGRSALLRERREARAQAYRALLGSRVELGGGGSFAANDGGMAPDPSALLLHATPAVLHAFLKLSRAEESGEGAGGAELAALIRAMRRDLGHRAPDMDASSITELIRVLERPASISERRSRFG